MKWVCIGTQKSLRQYQIKPQRLEAVLKVEKELGRTPIEPEVFKKTHIKKKENESDPDVWVEERAERTFVSYLI
ncbi:hypothetical protein R3W88_033864 [Solanum pinnatisectum]|uniref:Uncharacterized protein n=1 Tax=Solanum pinnatisectum TaxID=50273 RepID=A0AAV9K1F7_9SOLN|nr:hypothetical protein R3W88_033864 [Solanum pinnatisectum]